MGTSTVTARKGPTVAETAQPRSTYRVIWRVGQSGVVNHLIMAEDADEASRESATTMREAVGQSFELWRLEAVI